MQFLTSATLAALVSVASAQGNWSLFCGDVCGSNGTLIVSGGFYDLNTTCTNLNQTFNHCYLQADEIYYKAVLLEGADCTVSSTESEEVVYGGNCTSAGSWHSYMTVLNL